MIVLDEKSGFGGDLHETQSQNQSRIGQQSRLSIPSSHHQRSVSAGPTFTQTPPTPPPIHPQRLGLPPPYVTPTPSASASTLTLNPNPLRPSISTLSLPSISSSPLSSSNASWPWSHPNSSSLSQFHHHSHSRSYSHWPAPQRSNNLYITRSKGPIKGSWIIDTNLALPPAMLPPVEDGTARRNLKLCAKGGDVSAIVEVRKSIGGNRLSSSSSSSSSESTLSSSDTAVDERATLVFQSDTGSVKARLRRTESPLLHITCTAQKGSVTLYLPFDFQGPIRIHAAHKNVILSPALRKLSTTIIQSQRRSVHFVGVCPGPDSLWDRGDRVDIEAWIGEDGGAGVEDGVGVTNGGGGGKVKIRFVDEHEEKRIMNLEGVVRRIRTEGVVRYVGRMVYEGIEKTKERIVARTALAIAGGSEYEYGYGTGGQFGIGSVASRGMLSTATLSVPR